MTEKEALARWVLHELRSEELPRIAVEWLVEGKDAPALRELAGELNPIMADVGPLFDRAILELKLTLPDRETALRTLANEIARQIAENRITPHEGALLIWWDVTNKMKSPSRLLLNFVGAACELEELDPLLFPDGADLEKYRRQLEDSIRESAAELLLADDHQSPRASLNS